MQKTWLTSITDTVDRLLILCSRPNLGSQALSQIQSLLAPDLDWDKFIKKTSSEGTSPFLFTNLKQFANFIPASILGLLKEIYYTNTARNIYFYENLRPLFQEICSTQLKVALIKGARLAETLYHDIGLRYFEDIDLLVYPSDWRKLEKILKGLSFSANSDTPLLAIQKTGRLDWTSGPIFRKGRLNVEIHFNLSGFHLPFNLDKDLWESIQKRSISNIEANVLSLEYELCLLCLHALQHSYSRLIWLTDIAELASKESLNWDKIISICQTEKIHAPVYYGLHLANCLWPQSIPVEILKRFHLTRFEQKALRFLWPEEKVMSRILSTALPWFAPTFLSLLARKKILLLARNLLRFYFPPQDWVVRYYNIPSNSIKMYRHYIWRLYRPILILSKRILRTG